MLKKKNYIFILPLKNGSKLLTPLKYQRCQQVVQMGEAAGPRGWSELISMGTDQNLKTSERWPSEKHLSEIAPILGSCHHVKT